MSNSTQEKSDALHPSQAVLKAGRLRKDTGLMLQHEWNPIPDMRCNVCESSPETWRVVVVNAKLAKGLRPSVGFIADSHRAA
jgi:hypothetical protein